MTNFMDKPSRNPLTAGKLSQGGARFLNGLRLAGLATALLMVQAAFGQGITGTITGSVTDPTGAAVPNATVTITQVETNSVHTVKSSDAGTYSVPQLQPGHYTVKVDAPSFKQFQEANVVLTIDQIAQVNATLTIGAQTDVVDVTSTSPVIQTEDSSIGSVIDAQAIQNTPLNGRLSIVGLIALAPGVQASGAQDQLATRGVTAAVGTGARNSYGSLGSTLDGVTNQEVTLQRGEGEVPSLDAISQFKVLTTGAPAEFNQPAQIIVVSASGTNQLHGELLEFNRSKGTSAKTYNLSTAAAPARPPYERNEYGGNLNGPIYIPHVYNGKDRSFFFYAFEGFHLTQSYALSSQQPTLLERQGNFSEFLPGGICATTPTGTIITNPNFTNNVINSPTLLNGVDQQLLNILYPKPTQAGCGTNTFEQVSELSQSTRHSVRLDHKISDKDQIHFTYLRAFYGPNHTQGSDSLQGGNSQDGEHNSNFIVGYTHTFSPSLVLDVNGSYFHLPIYRTPQNVNTNFSSIIPGLGPELIEGAPQITISNITKVSESGSKDLEQDGQINTSITKVLTKHTLKAGFSYLYDNHWNDSAESPQRGAYTFNGQYAQIAFADFILGDPSSTQNAAPNNYITRNISDQYGVYMQDDWKPLPNLTINMGLRYDLQWFHGNPYGEESLYIPSLKEVVVFGNSFNAAAQAYVSANPKIPIALSSTVGLPSTVFAYLGQDKNNVAPRFGFAYEAKHNTVIRGAFGIYYNLLPSSYQDSTPFGTLPYISSVTYTNSTGTTTPAFTMNNPFSATGAFSANPSTATQPKTVTPYTEAYNLAVEHQFGKGVDLRIGYVGQHNLKQNLNGGPGTYNPNINLLDTPVVGVSAQSTNLVQPFSAINVSIDPIFHSSENALQIGLHKQYSHGIAIGAEYSWTRVLGTENVQNPDGLHPSDSYGPISGIAPQVLTVNYSYLLPFGNGQAFLGSSGNLVDKLVGGWQISGISVFQNGQPFSVMNQAPGIAGLVSGRADRIPGVPLYPANKTKAQWFNTAAFKAPNCYTATGGVGDCTTLYNQYKGTATTVYDLYGNSGYDLLRGPRFQDWDMSLQKNISFRTRYKLQLRADSFNVFNHPNFAVPNSTVGNSNNGTISAISSTPQYEQRTVEFAAKFNF